MCIILLYGVDCFLTVMQHATNTVLLTARLPVCRVLLESIVRGCVVFFFMCSIFFSVVFMFIFVFDRDATRYQYRAAHGASASELHRIFLQNFY